MTRLLATPLYFFVLCYLLVQAGYFLYNQITSHLTRRRLIKEHGCQPPKSFDEPSRLPYLYRLKMVKMMKSAVNGHRLLKDTQRKYQDHGYTHGAKVNVH